MKYSNELLVTFQNQYKAAYGESISLQDAEIELAKLARLVEDIFPEVAQINKERSSK